jgi:hypothetical protein
MVAVRWDVYGKTAEIHVYPWLLREAIVGESGGRKDWAIRKCD